VKTRARRTPGCPKRAKPKGASSSRRVNTRPAARDSRKGKNPETAARRAGPSPRRRDHRREKRYAGASPRKREDTFRKEKAPKGESHERRRREKEPARARRE